jgi:alkaline phosphatase
MEAMMSTSSDWWRSILHGRLSRRGALKATTATAATVVIAGGPELLHRADAAASRAGVALDPARFVAEDGHASAGRRSFQIEVTVENGSGLLEMDQMEVYGHVTTSGMDSIATDSANSASAYATGHKSAVNAMGVLPD